MRKWKNVKRILSFIVAIVLMGDMALGVYATMKENSIEQTAYIQGMCEELDMAGEEIKLADGVMMCDASEEDYEKAYLISQVNNEMAFYSETIGTETDFNFYLKIEKELNTHNNDNIKVYVETFDGYAPLETVFPKRKEELYKEGQNYIEEQKELYEKGEISLAAAIDNYSVEESSKK